MSVSTDSPPPSAPGPTQISRIQYAEGGSWPLIGRHILNVILMVLTLGLYRFWAITKMRQILWRRIRFDGQPLEYTGTGLEIFLGFVRVFLIVLLPLGILYAIVALILSGGAAGTSLLAVQTADILYGVVILLLIELGRFLSWRYRISRTRWRGIRGRIDLAVTSYFKVAVGSALMLVFTGWILKPVVDLYRAKAVIDALNVGGLKGRYLGGLFHLFGLWIGIGVAYLVVVGLLIFSVSTVAAVFAITPSFDQSDQIVAFFGGALVGSLVATFLISVYRVAFWRLICKMSRVGPVQASFSGTALGYAWLTLGNWLILVFSLGLLAPITWERKIRYLAANVTFTGVPDPATLRQVEEDDGAIGGEGLAGDFDIA